MTRVTRMMRLWTAWRPRLRTVAVVGVVAALAVWSVRSAGSLQHTVRQVSALPAPSWPPILVAAGASVLGYVFSAFALHAAAGRRLPLPRTVAVQFAAAVANRFTVGGIGGAAVNGRYLASEGVGLGATGAAVSLTGLAHVLVAAIGIVALGPLVGNLSVGQAMFGARVGGVPVVVVAAAVVALAAWPVAVLVRRRLDGRLRSALADAASALRSIARSPRRLVVLIGSTAAVKATNLVALLAATWAFDGDISGWRIAVVYLVGVPAAEAVPTPGGLGTVDAVLVAGLTHIAGGTVASVVAAVVVYRLLTFWAPIVPGLIASAALRHRLAPAR
jgi:uncharacterized membrane protein YbhN (UPF0104 family)